LTSTATSTTKTLAQKNDTAQNENRQYTVQEGDNLFNIARRELGDITRWKEIQRLNSGTLGSSVDYLTPGTVISMPK
jgi:nucleoid-associated protein YgaU